jgi:hypothetical protein
LPLNSNAAGNIILAIIAIRKKQATGMKCGRKVNSIPRQFFVVVATVK